MLHFKENFYIFFMRATNFIVDRFWYN